VLQIFGCRKKMSAIAILDHSGAEDLYKEMEQLAQDGRKEWEAYRSEVLLPSPTTCVTLPLPLPPLLGATQPHFPDLTG